jgi:phage-related protein/exonuclease VII small subunit
MATVAELSVELDAKDKGAAEALRKLGAQVESIDGKAVDIDVVPIEQGPYDDLLALRELVEGIDGKDANIGVEAQTADVVAALELVNEQIDMLEKASATIETDADVAQAEAKLDMLRAIVADLDGENIRLEADVDTAAAIAHLAALDAMIHKVESDVKDIDDGEVVNLSSAFQKLSTVSQRTSTNISGLTAAIVGMAPALAAIGAVGAAGLGMVGAAAGAAGVAVGAFGFSAMSALSPVGEALTKLETLQQAYNTAITDKQKETALAKIDALMRSLEPGQLAVLQGVLKLKDNWAKLNENVKPEIYQMAAEAMDAIGAALPKLGPLLIKSVDAFHNLQRASLEALGSPVWQEFFDNIESNAGPAMESLGRSMGNLVTGLVGVINAFFPFVDDFNGGLESMTAAFADWGTKLGDSPGFKAFMQYVQDMWPKVKDAFAKIVEAVVALVVAAAPLAGPVLDNLTAFATAVATLGEKAPGLLTFSLALAGIGAVIMNIVGPILNLIGLFKAIGPFIGPLGEMFSALGTAIVTFATGPVGLAIAAVAAIGAAFTLAYNYITPFRDAVNNLGTLLAGFGATIMAAFSAMGQAISQFFADMVAKVVAWGAQYGVSFSAVWEGIKAGIAAFLAGAVNLITTGLATIAQNFSTVWTGLGDIVRGAWDVIKGIISGGIDIVLGIVSAFISLLTGNWQGLWDSAHQIFRGAQTILAGIVHGGLQIILGLFEAAVGVYQGVFGTIWDGVKAVTAKGWETIKALIPNALNGIIKAIEDFGSRMYQAGAKIITQLGDGIKAKAQAAVDAVRNTVDQMAGYLPGSPAEVGPLSGHGYVKLRGQRFVDDLATGLADSGRLDSQVAALADTLSVSPKFDGMSAARLAKMYSGAPGASAGMVITVAQGAVTVDARGSTDAAAVRSAVNTASATLADQLRSALETR